MSEFAHLFDNLVVSG